MLGSCGRYSFQKVFSPSTMTVFESIFEPFWGHVEELTLETLQYYPCEAFFLQNLAHAWLGIAKMPLNGPMLAHFGAMLTHLGSMLGPGSPILGLCWGYVRWFWGYVVFMSSPSFPNFAWKSSPQWPARHPRHLCNTISLKKLNPAWEFFDLRWYDLQCQTSRPEPLKKREGFAA